MVLNRKEELSRKKSRKSIKKVQETPIQDEKSESEDEIDDLPKKKQIPEKVQFSLFFINKLKKINLIY